ncbi:MAG TPA: hypothetical protein DCG14_09795, partial [Phycisphaerales bacterium]|nr:hypothetical protein [Phycisphaerales bacterium]
MHTLAKELGVSSKDIIAKCVAEDIPDITNHMSAVSVGLSHTVREWFSVAAEVSSTAVETAAKVDVVKARAKAKKATKKVAPKEEPTVETPAPPKKVETVEAPGITPIAEVAAAAAAAA